MSSLLWTACHKLFLKTYQVQSSVSLQPVLIFNFQCLLVPLLLSWTRSSFLGIVAPFDLPPPPSLGNSFSATKSPSPKDQSLPVTQSSQCLCISGPKRNEAALCGAAPFFKSVFFFFWKPQLKGRCETSAIRSASVPKARELERKAYEQEN